MGPEYSCALRPKLARTSRRPHKRFSSELVATFFRKGQTSAWLICFYKFKAAVVGHCGGDVVAFVSGFVNGLRYMAGYT